MTRRVVSVFDERRDPAFPSNIKVPEPIRDDGKGSDILGPTNPDRQRQAADTVCPPVTDAGKMPNMKWFVAKTVALMNT